MTLREPPKQRRTVNLIGRFLGLIVLLGLFAVVVWTAATLQQVGAVERTDPLVHAPGEYVTVPGGALHMVSVGNASTDVVFLHHDTVAGGAPLVPLATRLAERERRVLLPDMVGFGFSVRRNEPGRSLSTTGQAESLAALLEEVGGAPFQVVGFGWGGEVAAELAVVRPDLVGSLVLVDTSALPYPRTGLESLEALPFGVGEAVSYTYDGADPGAERRFQEECPSWAECSSAEVLERFRRAASIPGTAASIRSRRASAPASLASARLEQITAPVTVVAVDMTRAEADELAGEFPEAEAVEAAPAELSEILTG